MQTRTAPTPSDTSQRPAALRAQLDAPLPEQIATGSGTAIFVCGWCFCPQARIRSLEFVVQSTRQPVMAHGMPRLDLFRSLHPGLDPFRAADERLTDDPSSEEDPRLLSYRSGFWGIVRLAAPDADGDLHEIELRAELDDGAVAAGVLARVRLTRTLARAIPQTPVVRATEAPRPRVAICMATYNPPPDLLAVQLQSIREQTHRNWICLISDDGSTSESVAALDAAVGDDPRFAVSHGSRRLGFYHNFERALAMVDADAEFVALADQDDRWEPAKLETLLERIGDAPLVYSDARIVARDGELISDTYWSRRRNNHSDLLSLFVANAVSGAASMIRRDLLDEALPFPPGQFSHYHDHWLALVALSLGEIRFVDRPLYDYVQHGGASLGHERANRMPALADRLLGLRTRSPRERIRKWRMHYFVDISRLMQFAAVLEMRCGERLTPDARAALDTVLDSDHSLRQSASFLRRGARELVGQPETLGAEWMLWCALVWRRLLAASTRDLPQRRFRLDAVPPTSLAPSHRHEQAALSASAHAIANKIAPLDLDISDDAPRRINLLLPTIDLDHLFGGYIAKFNLAARLASRGHQVRIVTVDPTGALPRDWKQRLESYDGLERLTDLVEVAFGREQGRLQVNPADRFIATTWWTAHLAHRAQQALDPGPFLYMIQEYEPFTFPMSTHAALASDSYTFPHTALFSTELLRGYFRAHSIGVYEAGADAGDQASATFDNAITRVTPPALDELEARAKRRLLFYARPEPHAARNLFELGLLALDQAARRGCFDQRWELNGIGTVQDERQLTLADGSRLSLVRRADQYDYARLLTRHDLGLALMYTPHPSLVPLEMASAGMLTVTNSFENKTADALRRISPNLVAADASIDSIADALGDAVARVDDYAGRVAGAAIRWPRTWDESFDAEVLSFVERAVSARG